MGQSLMASGESRFQDNAGQKHRLLTERRMPPAMRVCQRSQVTPTKQRAEVPEFRRAFDDRPLKRPG